MNLGLDVRLLRNNTGIGRYTRSLFLEYAQKNHVERDHVFLFSDKLFPPLSNHDGQLKDVLTDLPENFHIITARCKPRILWTNWHVPLLLRRHKIDVYHGVCNFELPIRKVCRYVVTIHDLVPLFFPELVPHKHLLFFKLFMKRVAHIADIIITDSEHSKHDIIQYLHVAEEKVRVVYLGYEARQKAPFDPQAFQNMLGRYGIRQPYLLFVGVIEPKKNLERLVDAFVLLRRENEFGKDLQLVIAGGKGWFYEQLYHKVQELKLDQQIVFTEFFPEEELALLYRGAELFVFPSIYEGFGLPVVEAMSFGVPVVTSNVSSLPEIAGNAGILVDPYEPAAICQGIVDVLADEGKKEEMRQAGRTQAQKFSWQRTAKETYKVYREAYQM